MSTNACLISHLFGTICLELTTASTYVNFLPLYQGIFLYICYSSAEWHSYCLIFTRIREICRNISTSEGFTRQVIGRYNNAGFEFCARFHWPSIMEVFL